MDQASENKLSKVHPLLAERVRKVIADLLPVEYRVVQGLRTYAEQDALFNQRKDGKDNDGDHRIDESDERVTNARGGFSNHNFGLAVDLCPFIVTKNAEGKTIEKADWDNNLAFNEIGKAVHAVGGLEWGGDWKFVDKPHVQLPGLTVSLCRSLFEQGGVELVWRKVSELNIRKSDTGIPASEQTSASQAERDLKFRDTGDDVRALQVKLGINVDGAFGAKTKAAVIQFQDRNKLFTDGIVGKDTREKLGL